MMNLEDDELKEIYNDEYFNHCQYKQTSLFFC